MNGEIRPLYKQERLQWDRYAEKHPEAYFAHLSGCINAIRRVYGLKTYCLGFFRKPGNDQEGGQFSQGNGEALAGILPMVHMRHLLFGNQLVSMPYFDAGGILADDPDVARALVQAACELAGRLRIPQIELRMASDISPPPPSMDGESRELVCEAAGNFNCSVYSEKVRMLLPLHENADSLMKSFKSKLRSQIRKPMRDGLQYQIGGLELLDDFYRIFCINMRDLGSPVHSKSFIRSILETLGPKAAIVVAQHEKTPLASSVIVGMGDTLYNPWSSALRSHNRLNPNMLLYWAMLEYGCNAGYKQFDFGRSTPGEGTYKFKEQWGARPVPLYWRIYGQDVDHDMPAGGAKSRFGSASRYWRKMPLPLTKIIGPSLRKRISL